MTNQSDAERRAMFKRLGKLLPDRSKGTPKPLKAADEPPKPPPRPPAPSKGPAPKEEGSLVAKALTAEGLTVHSVHRDAKTLTIEIIGNRVPLNGQGYPDLDSAQYKANRELHAKAAKAVLSVKPPSKAGPALVVHIVEPKGSPPRARPPASEVKSKKTPDAADE
jgi:hypothetical protein